MRSNPAIKRCNQRVEALDILDIPLRQYPSGQVMIA